MSSETRNKNFSLSIEDPDRISQVFARPGLTGIGFIWIGPVWFGFKRLLRQSFSKSKVQYWNPCHADTTSSNRFRPFAYATFIKSMLEAATFQRTRFKVWHYFCASITSISLATLAQVEMQPMLAISKCPFFFFLCSSISLHWRLVLKTCHSAWSGTFEFTQ